MSGKNFFSRKSYRLQKWDYSWNGLYFVTTNTKNHEHFFGKVIDGKMNLNELGLIVEQKWLETISIRHDMNIHIDEFVVMPNHFHAIIGIGKNEYNSGTKSGSSHEQNIEIGDVKRKLCKGEFGPQIKNLGSIMRGFKSSVTSWCIKNNIRFEWQSRYHDIIIRDERCLNNVRRYIRNNPAKWSRDRHNKR